MLWSLELALDFFHDFSLMILVEKSRMQARIEKDGNSRKHTVAVEMNLELLKNNSVTMNARSEMENS